MFFLSCLLGSEHLGHLQASFSFFLSCLLGSERQDLLL